MTIASAITNAQQKVENAYTSVSTMGGTLPATQNLSNLPAAIESIPTGGGGGDTIYLPNESGSTISAGDKVLFSLGKIGSDTPTVFTLSIPTNNSNFSYGQPIVFDNETFVASPRTDNGAIFQKIDNVWVRNASSVYDAWARASTIQYFDDGTIAGRQDAGNLNYSYLYYKSGKTGPVGTSTYRYCGKYNGVEYVATNTGVWEYIRSSNTTGNQKVWINYNLEGQGRYARIYGNKLVLSTSSGYVYVYEIDSEGAFTQIKKNKITGEPLLLLYATGCEEGDYLFVTEDNAPYVSTSLISSTGSCLFIYKFDSDHGLISSSDPMLDLFTTTKCYVVYDNRNNVLSIGTKNNAYFFEFDTVNKKFSRLDITLNNLPTQQTNIPYRVTMMPDKSAVVVEGDSYVNVYALSTAHHCIVSNSVFNYDLVTSFTGFATGETDGEGNYEVNAVLPEQITYTFCLDEEPDSYSFEGDITQ